MRWWRASRGPAGLVLFLVLATALLAACGVEPQEDPERVPVARLPQVASPSAGTPMGQARVWGAREQRLVPVFVPVSAPGAEPRLRALLALSDPDQQAPTLVPRGTRLVSMSVRTGNVDLALSEEFRRASRRDLPLVLGQIVLTLTEDPGVQRVRVRVRVRAGDAAVPSLDGVGRDVGRPLVRSDFTTLVQEAGED